MTRCGVAGPGEAAVPPGQITLPRASLLAVGRPEVDDAAAG